VLVVEPINTASRGRVADPGQTSGANGRVTCLDRGVMNADKLGSSWTLMVGR
jgi:hypothetical protein